LHFPYKKLQDPRAFVLRGSVKNQGRVLRHMYRYVLNRVAVNCLKSAWYMNVKPDKRQARYGSGPDKEMDLKYETGASGVFFCVASRHPGRKCALFSIYVQRANFGQKTVKAFKTRVSGLNL
jgi:hypothetical protein